MRSDGIHYSDPGYRALATFITDQADQYAPTP
jgi:hypothetical protein